MASNDLPPGFSLGPAAPGAASDLPPGFTSGPSDLPPGFSSTPQQQQPQGAWNALSNIFMPRMRPEDMARAEDDIKHNRYQPRGTGFSVGVKGGLQGGPILPAEAFWQTLGMTGVNWLDQMMKPDPRKDPGIPDPKWQGPTDAAHPAPNIHPQILDGPMMPAPGEPPVPQKLKSLFRPQPARGATKVWTPAAGDGQFPANAAQAMNEVKTYGALRTEPIEDRFNDAPNGYPKHAEGNEDMLSGITNTKAHLNNAFDFWMERARRFNTRISGQSIVDATERSLPTAWVRENPEEAGRYMQAVRAAYGNQDFSPDEMRGFLTDKNAETEAFHNKTPAMQNVQTIAGSNPALAEAQAKAIRESLYTALDPENAGVGPREIQRRLGTVKDLEKGVQANRNRILSEKPVTPIGGLWNAVAGPAKMWMAKRPSMMGEALMHPWKGPSDALIERMMRNMPGDAVPPPMPEGGLPPHMLPPGSDPSGSYTGAARDFAEAPNVAENNPNIAGLLPSPEPPNSPSRVADMLKDRAVRFAAGETPNNGGRTGPRLLTTSPESQAYQGVTPPGQVEVPGRPGEPNFTGGPRPAPQGQRGDLVPGPQSEFQGLHIRNGAYYVYDKTGKPIRIGTPADLEKSNVPIELKAWWERMKKGK